MFGTIPKCRQHIVPTWKRHKYTCSLGDGKPEINYTLVVMKLTVLRMSTLSATFHRITVLLIIVW